MDSGAPSFLRKVPLFAEPTTCAVLEQAELDRLLTEHPSLGRGIMAVLAERLDVANRHAGIDFVNLSRLKIDARVATLLPQALITQHRVMPIAFCNNRLTLAMTNPDNIVAFDDVRRVLKGVVIEPAVITEDDFKRFMATTYPQLIAHEEAGQQPHRPGPAHPGGAPAAAKSGAAPSVGLLESDLIRELQLAADTGEAQAETKQDLMSASGRLVFTTLHTNNAAAAFTRLHEMDIEPFLVSSSTIGVIAQRLARRLCQQCREPYAADAAVARAEEIHAAALDEGMIDLKRYSAQLLAEGLTSVEEVTSVVSVDI